MIGPIRPGAPFDAFAEAFEPGLEGTISVSIYDINDTLIQGPTTAGITEIAPIGDLARYGVTLYAPDSSDTYLVVWDDNQLVPNSASEELLVSNAVSPITPVSWITGADVALCCDADAGSDTSVFDAAADAANGVLFELSARQFPGIVGPTKVRPYGGRCVGWWGYSPPVWTSSAGWLGSRWGSVHRCGCPPLSFVRLAGGYVREITAVKIDGAFLTASEYRLDEGNLLVRMRDSDGRRQFWPNCQILDLADTELGTFSVTYTWGQDPPQIAVDAAVELACQIYQSCTPSSPDCQLPTGTTRVQRLGVTVDRALLAKGIREGDVNLPMVDLFLGTYNPSRTSRQSAVWSPDTHAWPWRPGA